MTYTNQPTTQANILIVDDVPDNLRLLSTLLKEQGYKVRSVINGPMALDAVQAMPPDLILLDVKMPDMDGYEVCRQLKAMPDQGTIPVIFLSGLDDIQDKVTAFASGGVDYITKPVEAQEVLVRVQTHLAIRSAEAEIRRLNMQLEDRVQQRTQQLSDTVYRLEQEVARRQQTEQILQTAKNTAEAANRAKSEFLANMSHELRTPLHIILSYANFGLNRTHLPPNKIQTYFQHIDQHGRTLLHLLDALLDLGQLDAKQMALHCEYEDLRTVIRIIIDEFQPLLSHHQLHLQYDLPETPILTFFDTKGIKQVLRHLLSRV